MPTLWCSNWCRHLGLHGYQFFQDYQNGFAKSVGNVLSVNATLGEAFDVGYNLGGFAGSMIGAGAGIYHAKTGYEIPLSSTAGRIERVAPFGKRTNHPYGRFTHYHRRDPDPARPGASIRDQGRTRYRPFEKGKSDKSIWDRF